MIFELIVFSAVCIELYFLLILSSTWGFVWLDGETRIREYSGLIGPLFRIVSFLIMAILTQQMISCSNNVNPNDAKKRRELGCHGYE